MCDSDTKVFNSPIPGKTPKFNNTILVIKLSNFKAFSCYYTVSTGGTFLRWHSKPANDILQKSVAATHRIIIPLHRSWEELLSALQLSSTYKPNYKELEIELLGTFSSSVMDH